MDFGKLKKSLKLLASLTHTHRREMRERRKEFELRESRKQKHAKKGSKQYTDKTMDRKGANMERERKKKKYGERADYRPRVIL